MLDFLEFDYENQKVYSLEKIRKVDLKLTPIEFKLLNLFSSSPNTILMKAQNCGADLFKRKSFRKNLYPCISLRLEKN